MVEVRTMCIVREELGKASWGGYVSADLMKDAILALINSKGKEIEL